MYAWLFFCCAILLVEAICGHTSSPETQCGFGGNNITYCIVAWMSHVKHANQNIALGYTSLGNSWENPIDTNTAVSLSFADRKRFVWNAHCSTAWVSTNVGFVAQFKTGQSLRILSHHVQKCFCIAEVMLDVFYLLELDLTAHQAAEYFQDSPHCTVFAG